MKVDEYLTGVVKQYGIPQIKFVRYTFRGQTAVQRMQPGDIAIAWYIRGELEHIFMGQPQMVCYVIRGRLRHLKGSNDRT